MAAGLLNGGGCSVARYNDSVCRLCRREGMKLFLKGERCYTDKCAFERRGYPPGQHGQRRIKFSDYGIQLREKQKVRRIYGVSERQFRNYFAKADRQKGITGANLLILLERRLDNTIYRFGFATSRQEARQLVGGGHFAVNGRTVSIPSYLVKPNDVIEVKEKSKGMQRIKEAVEGMARRGMPQWLALEKDTLTGTVRGWPDRAELTTPPIQEQLIVELYSK
jgi:small subunit ribosomal protein S4